MKVGYHGDMASPWIDGCSAQTWTSSRTQLLVEDDWLLRDALSRSLSDLGYVVYVATCGLDALRILPDRSPDSVVLDLGLPDIDGSQVLGMIRGVSYMVKPFSVEEPAATLSAVLRRSLPRGDNAPEVLSIAGLRIDQSLREVTLDGQPLDLNRKELNILEFLATHTHRVVTRKELVKAVWGRPGSDQSVDLHISWIRRKLGESAAHPSTFGRSVASAFTSSSLNETRTRPCRAGLRTSDSARSSHSARRSCAHHRPRSGHRRRAAARHRHHRHIRWHRGSRRGPPGHHGSHPEHRARAGTASSWTPATRPHPTGPQDLVVAA
jgi:DNA-binding response OmpR family regulator